MQPAKSKIRRMRRYESDPKRSRESRRASRSIRAYFELLGKVHSTINYMEINR